MFTGRKRHHIIQQRGSGFDYLSAADRIKARAFFAAVFFGKYIGAVQRIVQAAPACVGSIERITRIADRHHQLRSGNAGNFRVDTRGGNLEVIAFRYQVSDIGQELFVCREVHRARVRLVPFIDLCLDLRSFFQQGPVFWRQVGHQSGETRPEIHPVLLPFPG